MNYLHPERLALLGVVVVLGLGYLVVQRRRSTTAAVYASPALQPSLVPHRPGWRRHVAPALALVALALTLVSVAQPTRTERVPRERGVVVLALDVSLSMTATDIEPSRIEAAIEGASGFVEDIPDGIEVGLVAFDGDARLLVSPTTDHATVIAAIGSLTTDERTATGEGVFVSLDAIASIQESEDTEADPVPAAIVLLSDGVATVGRSLGEAAAAAVAAEIPITTIAYGTPTGTVSLGGQLIEVPADNASMAAVANRTGGTYFEATSAGELRNVYTDIQTTIGFETVQREVGRAWLGGAFLVAIVGIGFSILTTNRAL